MFCGTVVKVKIQISFNTTNLLGLISSYITFSYPTLRSISSPLLVLYTIGVLVVFT